MLLDSLTDEELIRHVDADGGASERERVLAERLDRAHRYISEVESFLHQHDLVQVDIVNIQ